MLSILNLRPDYLHNLLFEFPADMYLTVTLDLFIMRSFFRMFRKAPFIGKECEGMVYVVDEWAGKFVDELDYLRELENTERFRNLMMHAGDAVMVPQVYQYTP